MKRRNARRGFTVLMSAALSLVGLSAACGSDLTDGSATTASTAAVTASTCAEAVLGFVPDGLEMVRRDLVPYSPRVRGITTDYAETGGGGRTITVVSGGFLDEVTEAYDNLEVGLTRLLLGQEVNVLVGSVLDTPVRVVLWRTPETQSPCDVHAIVATKVSDTDFEAVLDGVRLG